MIIDFLFYYTSIHFDRINSKYGFKKMDSSSGARNLLFISTILWIMIFVYLVAFLVLKKTTLVDIHWTWILLISILIYGILNYVYIEKNRLSSIREREQGVSRKFKLAERNGTLIVSIYIYSSFIIIFLALIIRAISK